MKIITIIGARPQFIKAATVSRVISKQRATSGRLSLDEIIIHTGQHYDDNMSRVFFDQLDIPAPLYNLAVGSGYHGHMTGQMLSKVEKILIENPPDCVLVYGDTNSTIAGALAAAKLNIPVAHVEAGLRSFNMQMPEEVNRVITDHISTLLFAPTRNAIDNLKREGITHGVIYSGDVMLDAFLFYRMKAVDQSQILSHLGLVTKCFYLATIHRQENTDSEYKLAAIFKALAAIGNENNPVIIPLHPRTRKKLLQCGFVDDSNVNVKIIEPVGYLDMIQLENAARIILTDSGGVQKEAYFSGVPCVTLRDETEWIETTKAGVNFLAGAETDCIIEAFEKAIRAEIQLNSGLHGDGHAADIIVKNLISHFSGER
jgi:UDP-GlcNAc3NAcA epimerase